MRGSIAALILVLTVHSSFALTDATTGEQQARSAAVEFGAALARSNASLLLPVLPQKGKVRMRLLCLGPEDGSFSASQVQALFRDFLNQGAVESFRVLRVEGNLKNYAMVHARAKVIDRFGSPASLDLHLSFELEGTRWVLREILETPP